MGHPLSLTRETQAPTSPWALFSRSTLGASSSTPHATLGRGWPKADAGPLIVPGFCNSDVSRRGGAGVKDAARRGAG